MTDLTPSSPGPGKNDHQDDSERLENQLQHMAEKQFQRDMRRAANLLSSGNAYDAIPLLERCYAFRPDDVDVLTNLGGAYILAEKHRHAVPILEKASEIASDNPAVWSNLAAAHLGKLVTATRERQDRALAAYRRVIEIDPAYPNVHYNMGLIYVDRRDWDSAHAAFTRAIKTNPHDGDAKRMRQQVDEVRSRPSNPNNN
ncbi:MAG: tetratricopeptide repeat protein [Anaerolineae bacterium]|jgi:tetratricopeptide (TPR) repeat protein|nr:tetratricopeptide repeat protein [Anaerolineae bacterium]